MRPRLNVRELWQRRNICGPRATVQGAALYAAAHHTSVHTHLRSCIASAPTDSARPSIPVDDAKPYPPAARQRISERLVAVVKPRTAELVLVTSDGHPAGSLPAVPVATPWWQDIAPVVRAARDFHGVDVTILRLLDAELEEPPGGRVTYLAEVAEAVRARP